MNYEEFYQEMQPQEKSLKDGIASLQKLYKAILRETDSGDVKSLARDLSAMAQSVSALSAALDEAQSTVENFDTKAYFENGDFAAQMLDACKENGVDVQGSFPVYEMFPYRVKLDTENQDIYLDRKKLQCMRPQSFVDTVKKGQEKLNKVSFNAPAFAEELANVYDLAVLKLKKHIGADIYLSNLYKILAPMGRFRKDYDQQSFAFDLARLYSSGIEETKSGRRFQFGTSREFKKAFRILDSEGHEQFLATICFYNKEG